MNPNERHALAQILCSWIFLANVIVYCIQHGGLP